jgi:uncharacterized protein (TIGR02118 family)
LIRLIVMHHRKPGMSRQDYEDYWLHEHGPLVSRHARALGIRRYLQTHVITDDPLNEVMREIYGSTDDLYDGFCEYWFSDRADLEHALGTVPGKAACADLIASEKEFMDHARSTLYFAFDCPQIYPVSSAGEWTVAREYSSMLKWLAVLWAPARETIEWCQRQWLYCHGPLLRQSATAMPLLRYLQVHVMDDPLTERFRGERGTREERIFGHAELWFDRFAFAAAAGAETDTAFGLMKEDGAMFIDLPLCHFMVSKEYVFIDLPLCVSPLPRYRAP